ncbi:MAG: YlxR family protein [Coriobacteriales bacterium]|nr:YlxR family protein [Coriobacteriales bacterium]
MRQLTQHTHSPCAKTRKEPLRSCVACRQTNDKRALIRFVRTTAGEVLCDPTGRQVGRGAYLCGEQRCFELAQKKRLLDRALRAKLSEADYRRLEDEYAALSGER